MFAAPLATLPEVEFPDSKIAPHNLYRVRPDHLPAPLAPQFPGFHPFFKKFFAQLARQRPPCAESPHHTLAQPKTPGIPRQNRPFTPRRRPKIARKTPAQNPKKPAPHTPPRKKVE